MQTVLIKCTVSYPCFSLYSCRNRLAALVGATGVEAKEINSNIFDILKEEETCSKYVAGTVV